MTLLVIQTTDNLSHLARPPVAAYHSPISAVLEDGVGRVPVFLSVFLEERECFKTLLLGNNRNKGVATCLMAIVFQGSEAPFSCSVRARARSGSAPV